jgi:cytochrome P450
MIGFGYEFNSLRTDDPFASAYASIFKRSDASSVVEVLSNYMPWLLRLPLPRLLEINRARGVIIREAKKLVRDKQSHKEIGKDVLSLMIAENRKAEGKLADMELVDQVMTFLLAGHETTSVAV